MRMRWAIGAYRLAFALLTVTAIVVALVDQIESDRSVANFFSFFTVDGNLLGAAVFLFLALTVRRVRTTRVDIVRGAATVALVTIGVVFALLLEDEEVDLPLRWVDTVLHRIMPVVFAVDWVLDPPERPISIRMAAWWLAFPVAWTVYTMARGAIVGWYPYPFLDPAIHGVWGVAAYIAGVAAFIIIVAVIVRWVGNARSGGLRASG